jgi:hypothetical protein
MGTSTNVYGALHVNPPIPADRLGGDQYGALPLMDGPRAALVRRGDFAPLVCLRLRTLPDGRADAIVPLCGQGDLLDFYKLGYGAHYDVALIAQIWPNHQYTGYLELTGETPADVCRLGILDGGRPVTVIRRPDWTWPDLEREGLPLHGPEQSAAEIAAQKGETLDPSVAPAVPVHVGRHESAYRYFFGICYRTGEQAALDWFATHYSHVPESDVEVFRRRWAHHQRAQRAVG